jgi:hypothetical protein
MMGKTTNFGLNKFGSDGRISDEGYKFSDRDRDMLDSLLYSLFNHDHMETADATLAGPSHYPDVTLADTGGYLPASANYYYKVSYRDGNNNETGSSPAVFVATPSPLSPPPSEVLTTDTTGGTLVAGTYKYAMAYYQDTGGVTRAPNESTIVIPTGTSTNTVTIPLSTPPDDADGWKIYRKGPGDIEYWFLTNVANAATPPSEYEDDGTVSLDCTKKRPLSNTTNSTNKATISISTNDLPLDTRVRSWRIYRSTTGSFASSSLLTTVVETTTEGGSDLVTSYVDTGGTTVTGSPLYQTAVPPPVPQLDASGIFQSSSAPLPSALAPRGVHYWNTFIAGTLVDATTYNKTYVVHDMPAERAEVFFQTAPTGVDGSNYVIVRLKDDGTQNEIQSVYTSATTVNEVQRISNDATGGTFTLSFDGQGPTGDIAFDATPAQIKAALELLSNITTVNVAGYGTPATPWVIEFEDPGAQNVAQITATDTNLVGGSTTISTSTGGSDGGTFTLTYDGQTTGNIAFDAMAMSLATPDGTSIEEKLEALSNITSVSVTGTGIESDPWLIEFVNPGSANLNLMTADSTLLNGWCYVSTDTQGYGNTVVEIYPASEYHYWQSSLTDFGEQQAEDSPATGGVQVSDTLATNDVAMELDAQDETNYWTFGTLDAGEYVAKFWVSNADQSAEFDLDVIDNIATPTVMETLSVVDGLKVYTPAYEVPFTSTGVEDITLMVTKTDAGAGTVRVDKYQYEVQLPTFHAGSYLTCEVEVVGSPSTNGSDANVNLIY